MRAVDPFEAALPAGQVGLVDEQEEVERIDGRIALEYAPEGPSADSFGWLEGKR